MDGKYSSSRQPARRESRAAKNGASLFGKYPIITLLLLFGLVYFVVHLFHTNNSEKPGVNPSDTRSKVETTAERLASSSSETVAAVATAASSEPVTTTEATVPVTTTTEPVTTEAPSGWMAVDDRYFYDALFIGDSRTDGLCVYSTPGSCKHFSNQSMTIFDIMETEKIEAYGFHSLRDLLMGMEFGKIYIMLGINECGYDTGYFAETYASVVKEIRTYQPNALIYLQSILYVTQEHENNYPVFETANIKEKNEAIKALANGTDIFYLEVNDALNDGTDHLPADYTNDGAHLKPDYYEYWHNYLLENAYVDAKHPWEPENENTTEPEGAQIEHP